MEWSALWTEIEVSQLQQLRGGTTGTGGDEGTGQTSRGGGSEIPPPPPA